MLRGKMQCPCSSNAGGISHVHVCVQSEYLGGGGWRGWWGWLGCCIFGRRCLNHRRRNDNRVHLLPPFTCINTALCCSLRSALCLPVSACSRQLAFAADISKNVLPQQSIVPSVSTVKGASQERASSKHVVVYFTECKETD